MEEGHMNKTVLVESHEREFLEPGYYFALNFLEGWFVGRVTGRTWANLQPWSLGQVAAGGNLLAYDEIQDNQSRHYLEPPQTLRQLIYHTFWGITPTPARAKLQFPVRNDLGSMLAINRSLTDDVGFIDGHKSPFWGPFSTATEFFTVNETYPAFNILNPTGDAMQNVMLNFDQRQYSYSLVTEQAQVKTLLVGQARVKKYTMGTINPKPQNMPLWLKNDIGADMLAYTLAVMAGKE
jgi:hypothetical protein